MRSFHVTLLAALFACSNPNHVQLQDSEEAFISTALRLHELYITAGDCEEINGMIDSTIVFYENGQEFTYENMAKYCSYARPKAPYQTFSKQYLIQTEVGFDYVDQYYTNESMDSIREVSSRIWQKKTAGWVVTHMQVSREAAGQ